MAFSQNPPRQKPRMFFLVPSERWLTLLPGAPRESLGPLADFPALPEPRPEPQPTYKPGESSQAHTRGFFCDRFVY
jgi:hypothetical protein